MTQRVTRSITIRRPHREVAEFVTDPHRVLEVIPGFARFQFVQKGPGEGEEEWDVFLEVSTLHIGGRVVVAKPTEDRLSWRARRGTRHAFEMSVEPLGEHSRLTMTLEYGFAGLLVARGAEFLGRGIAARHLEAGLEEVRHLLEYGDAVSNS